MVPPNPEPLKQLQARYPAAVAKVYRHREPETFAQPPSGRPQHVFDTEDGMRLIVSREEDDDGHVGLHLSASVLAGPLWELLASLPRRRAMREFMQMAIERLASISGRSFSGSGEEAFLGWSGEKGVPHWWFKEPS